MMRVEKIDWKRYEGCTAREEVRIIRKQQEIAEFKRGEWWEELQGYRRNRVVLVKWER
jgi:hypothetical protein